jgi:hypothetical protein
MIRHYNLLHGLIKNLAEILADKNAAGLQKHQPNRRVKHASITPRAFLFFYASNPRMAYEVDLTNWGLFEIGGLQ